MPNKHFTAAEKASAMAELTAASEDLASAMTDVNTAPSSGGNYQVSDSTVDALDKTKGRIQIALADLGGKPCGGGRPC